ncbi:alpha/beta hydrolase family protein [Kitasatospora sp. NPDC127116]|uniref:alpha/beta hydrolase family protein n=1 Tax=Kitasatospora sp. NPDC127116 TaxID=3345367 RepID=UPI0036415408
MSTTPRWRSAALLAVPIAVLLPLTGPQAASAASPTAGPPSAATASRPPVPAPVDVSVPVEAGADVGVVAGAGAGLGADAQADVDEKAGAPQVPAPTTHRLIGAASVRLVDTGRHDPWRPDAATRELMATLWYPAQSARGGQLTYLSPEMSTARYGTPDLGAVGTGVRVRTVPAPGRHPLVVLSPGFGFDRSSLTALAEDLAARGYAVAALDHTYETAVQFPDGRMESCLICDKVDDRLAAEVIRSRAKDIAFLIDRLTAPGPGLVRGLRIDASRIGAAGHSIGGASAVEAMRVDGRIRAAANLDGDFFAPLPAEGLARPVLLLGAQRHAGETPTANWDETWQHLTGWKRWLDLPEGGHLSFCDVHWLVDALGIRDQVPPDTAPGQYGSIKGARALAATRAYLGAFFDRHLLDRPGRLLDGPSAAFPEVRFAK